MNRDSNMSQPSTRACASIFRFSLVAVAAAVMVGCASAPPQALSTQALKEASTLDAQALRKDVEPIAKPLTLDEAMARALKYNLDRRAKLMEEALALGQVDMSRYDMLPKVLAQAGYSWRDNDRITNSRDMVTGQPSTNRFVSQDRSHDMTELGLTWSLLDVGLGYHGVTQQQARYLIAGEKRRKAMHLLMQDVRTAYWRAASAQVLRDDLRKTVALADEALADARRSEQERVRNPMESLRFQRQLQENLRLLEAIEQELLSAQVDLAGLINAPVGQQITIAQTDLKNTAAEAVEVPLAKLEELALTQNADLREQHYNARIAREEVKRTMLRLFPNVTFNYGVKYDSDSYLVNQNWNEAGLQLSFNLMNLVTGSKQMQLAEAGVALADQRRMASHLSVLTQVHLARLQLIHARNQFDRADAIYSTDKKIAELMRNRQAVQAQSKLDVVSNESAAILSLLRRYQAFNQVQAAENRLMATLGMEPQIGSTSELSLQQLTTEISQAGSPWKLIKDGAVKVQAPAKAVSR
jgi:outer membrane protein TolC